MKSHKAAGRAGNPSSGSAIFKRLSPTVPSAGPAEPSVHAFARRTGLETYSFNPAFTPGTDLLRDDRVGNAFFRYVGPRFPRVNTLEQAGAQLAAVANGPRPAEPGAYIDRWDVTQSSPESYDERREEELWSEAERLTASAIA